MKSTCTDCLKEFNVDDMIYKEHICKDCKIKQLEKIISNIKSSLEMVCSYKSQIPLVEIGRENLTNDIDNEVIPKFRVADKGVIKSA